MLGRILLAAPVCLVTGSRGKMGGQDERNQGLKAQESHSSHVPLGICTSGEGGHCSTGKGKGLVLPGVIDQVALTVPTDGWVFSMMFIQPHHQDTGHAERQCLKSAKPTPFLSPCQAVPLLTLKFIPPPNQVTNLSL